MNFAVDSRLLIEAAMGLGQISIVVLSLTTLACVDDADVDPPLSSADLRATAHDEGHASPIVRDDFWIDEAIATMSEPKPIRPKSISLGYVGDAPLSGGVMRGAPNP